MQEGTEGTHFRSETTPFAERDTHRRSCSLSCKRKARRRTVGRSEACQENRDGQEGAAGPGFGTVHRPTATPGFMSARWYLCLCQSLCVLPPCAG
jgi:hypothetical protein